MELETQSGSGSKLKLSLVREREWRVLATYRLIDQVAIFNA